MTTLEPPVLRPLSLTQLLDRAIRLYRQHFLAFVGIIATALIPLSALQYLITVLSYSSLQQAAQEMRSASATGDSFRLLAAEMAAMGGGSNLIVQILSFLLVSGIATAALVKAVENSYMGRPVGIIDSYARVLGSWAALMIALIIGLLIAMGILIGWLLIPCLGWLTGLGMFVYFAYAIYTLIPITVVVEGKTAFGAITRAWNLTRRRFWWVLGFVIVLGILSAVIRTGPAALALLGGRYLSQSIMAGASLQTQYAIQAAITQMIQMLIQLIFLPLQTTALILMYFDLRVRTEGLDLAIQAASAGTDQPPAEGEPIPDSALLEIPPAPPVETGQLITLNEAGYFVAITVGAVALCAILYAISIAIVMAMYGAMGGL